jgi:hypothetical protein
MNYCAIDEKDILDNRHWLHHSHATPANYEGPEGFTVDTVPQDDPGPFAGMSYVKEHHLRIARAEALNADLESRLQRLHTKVPGEDNWQGTLKKRLGDYRKDYQQLVASVKAHESAHSRLALEGFDNGDDPASLIEWMVGSSPRDVAFYANIACGDAERRMSESSNEVRVHQALQEKFGKKATVLFPVSPTLNAFEELVIPTLAGAGDDDTK